MTALLGVRDVRVAHQGQQVLGVEALDLAEGAHVAVVGPNGAGKSTLLRVLALLERPTEGRVLVRGEPVPARGRLALAIRRRFAVVLQTAPLCDASVYDNVALGLRFRGIRDRDAAPRIRLWLDRFGIGHLSRRRVRTLSGGEAQRAGLARAFVLDPDILFLDEPFAALDSPSRDALLNDLETILREARTTVVTVTHDPEEAARLADALIVLVGGAVKAAGPKDGLLKRPPNRETAELFGFTVLPVNGRAVAVPPGALGLGAGAGAGTEPVRFALVVERVLDLGYERRVRGRVGNVVVEVGLPPECPPPVPGARMTVAASRAVPLP